ncbi:MAG: hypothetical protein HY053_03525 [Proteobacteria bacterium]|nr:hypothetical protein [Pseudomonadota bacterium]
MKRFSKTRLGLGLLAMLAGVGATSRGPSTEQRITDLLTANAYLCGVRYEKGVDELKNDIFFLKMAELRERTYANQYEYTHALSKAVGESERIVDRFIQDKCTIRLANG